MLRWTLLAASLLMTACSSAGVGGGVGIGKGGGGFGVGLGVGFPPRQQNTGIGPQVLFLGESLAAAGKDLETTWAYRSIDRINAYLAERRMARRVEAQYAGTTGAKVADVANQARGLARRGLAAAVIAFGPGDAAAGNASAEVEKGLDQACGSAADAGAKLVLVELDAKSSGPGPDSAAAYAEVASRVAKARNATLVRVPAEKAGSREEVEKAVLPALEKALEIPGA